MKAKSKALKKAKKEKPYVSFREKLEKEGRNWSELNPRYSK